MTDLLAAIFVAFNYFVEISL